MALVAPDRVSPATSRALTGAPRPRLLRGPWLLTVLTLAAIFADHAGRRAVKSDPAFVALREEVLSHIWAATS